MAKKKNNQRTPTGPVAAPKPSSVQKEQKPVKQETKVQEKQGFLSKYAPALLMAAIAVIVFLVLKVCLENQFTNWDDPGYVRDNALVKDVSSEGIRNIFSTAIMGNYHPLTMLSYAIEYSHVRLEPFLYHFDSLLIHIIATLLFFWFVYLLTRNTIAATVTALLFGLHPMHMESVAWIAARKDVLYGLFYAASCIFYLYYIRCQNKNKWGSYILSVILFICSILSKPVAVTLPVILFLIDYSEKRKFLRSQTGTESFNPIIYIEKIPFYLISIGFGIRSLADQREFKALNTLDVHYNLAERISLGAYAFITYLWKAVVPVGLSNFYPYPEKVNDILPYTYYFYILGLAALFFIVWKYGRKNKDIVFGCLFFLINIILLLQFIPVGGAILADRYSYIPYLGLFFIAGRFIAGLFEQGKNPMSGKLAIAGIAMYLCVMSFLSYQRCMVWYDTVSLWRDEVEKHPDVPSAFNNLGFEYFNRGYIEANPKTRESYFDSAVISLKEAVRLQPTFVNPYVSLGEVARSRNNFPEAKMYYYKALKLSTSDEAHNAYLGLAIIYCITGQQAGGMGLDTRPYFDSAQYCFRTALQVKPYFPEAHSNYGNFFDMMHNFDSSYKEYSLSISQNPDMYASYLNRARLLQRHNKCDEAFKDFAKAIEVSPDIGEIYYGRSNCYLQKGDKRSALQDVEHARALGFTQIDPAYYQSLRTP